MKNHSVIQRESCNKFSGSRFVELAYPTISLVVKGRKIIRDGNETVTANALDILYTPAGRHYIDIQPPAGSRFEEIAVHFAPGQLAHNLATLSSALGMSAAEPHSCPQCRDSRYATFPSWRAVRNFFTSLGPLAPAINSDRTLETLKKMELLTLIAANPECCIQSRIFADNDPRTESFEAIIRENIFADLSLKELAERTNRSLTSFKNEFQRRFREPPHTWQIRQRLAHARMLLITTALPISEIGTQCRLNNASHFISLFSREYGLTPAVYRKQHQGTPKHEAAPAR